MAAGLGFKTFTVGEVLSAENVNGYLMQGVLVFANAAARDAAITSPQEGQFAYLKDTNVTTYYTGSAWANLDTTGMTNPMTTTGDTIYSSSGSTPARLGIGTAGQVLQVNSGATAPEWAAPAAGGMTLLNSGGTTLSGGTTTISFTSTGYTSLKIYMRGLYANSDTAVGLRINGDTGSNYSYTTFRATGGQDALGVAEDAGVSYAYLFNALPTSDSVRFNGTGVVEIFFPNNSDYFTIVSQTLGGLGGGPNTNLWQTVGTGIYDGSAVISSITFRKSSGSFSGGTAFVYGVK